MISLLNAVLPRGEALLIWLLDTLCRMHNGFKLANTLTSLKLQGSKKQNKTKKPCRPLLFILFYFIYLFISAIGAEKASESLHRVASVSREREAFTSVPPPYRQK